MSFYQNDFISSKTFFNISVFKEITEVVVFIAPVRIMKHKVIKKEICILFCPFPFSLLKETYSGMILYVEIFKMCVKIDR